MPAGEAAGGEFCRPGASGGVTGRPGQQITDRPAGNGLGHEGGAELRDWPPAAQEDHRHLRDLEGLMRCRHLLRRGRGGGPGRCVTVASTNIARPESTVTRWLEGEWAWPST
jgi:hypothetical protein